MQHTAYMKGTHRKRKNLAAIKLPISEKWVLKSRFFGTSSSGSALFSQQLTRGSQNCKTFMRRFDPDPRLQILLQPRAIYFWAEVA
jgi:hypothetical protein